MKILKQSQTYNPNWTYRCVCNRCSGEYEFDKHDLEKIFMGEDGMSCGFRCPNADCMNFIPAPSWVRPFEDDDEN